MKSLIFNLLILFSFNATQVVASEITAEKVIAAIEENDFDFITNAIKTSQINPNELFNGKTLLIIAVEDDNAEMINHLHTRTDRIGFEIPKDFVLEVSVEILKVISDDGHD